MRPLVTLTIVLMAGLLTGYGAGQNVQNGTQFQTLEVCKSSSWQDLVILKTPKPPSFFANISDWDKQQFSDWVAKDLRREWLASVIFAGIALASALIFFLWRILHCCCQGCYCSKKKQYIRDSLENGQAAEPYSAPIAESPSRISHMPVRGQGCWSRWHASNTSCAMMMLKVILAAFLLCAAALTAYGIDRLSKGIAKQGWEQVNVTANYVDTLSQRIDGVLNNVSSFVPIIDRLQGIAATNVQINTLHGRIQNIQQLLQNPSLQNSALGNSVTTAHQDLQAVNTTLASLTASLPGLVNQLNQLKASAASVSASAQPLLQLQTTLQALQQQLNAMPATRSDTAVASLKTAIDNLNLAARISYVQQLTSDLQVLETMRTNNPVAAAIQSLNTLQTAIKNASVSLPALSTNLKQLVAAGNPSVLINQTVMYLDGINTNVFLLDGTIGQVYSGLKEVQGLLNFTAETAGGIPAFTQQIDSLTPQLVFPPEGTTLTAALTRINTAITALPSGSGFIGFLNGVSTSLTNLKSPLDATSASITAYNNAPSDSTYNALSGTFSNALTATNAAVTAATPTTPQSTDQNNVRAGATTVVTALTTDGNYATLVNNFLSAASVIQQQMQQKLPADLFASAASYGSQAGNLANQLPPDVNQSISSMADTLRLVNALVFNTGDTVKQQINDEVSKYNTSASLLRTNVVDREIQMRDKYYDTTVTVDKWRYIGMIIIYSLGLFLLTLLFLAALFNIPALMTLTVTGIHVIVFFYFVCAVVLAFILAAANDMCPAAETAIKSFTGPKYVPVADYLFFNQGGNLSTVLLNSGIIDVTNIDQQVNNTQSQVTLALTALSIQPVGAMRQALLDANTTADSAVGATDQLLQEASYQSFNPVYASSKSYVCCTLPNEFGQVWNAYTGAGWVMLAMVWISYILIIMYDRADGAHARCGWLCLSFPHRMKNQRSRSISQAPLTNHQPVADPYAAPYTAYAEPQARSVSGDGQAHIHIDPYAPSAPPMPSHYNKWA